MHDDESVTTNIKPWAEVKDQISFAVFEWCQICQYWCANQLAFVNLRC